jgi:hypothetical protein
MEFAWSLCLGPRRPRGVAIERSAGAEVVRPRFHNGCHGSGLSARRPNGPASRPRALDANDQPLRTSRMYQSGCLAAAT